MRLAGPRGTRSGLDAPNPAPAGLPPGSLAVLERRAHVDAHKEEADSGGLEGLARLPSSVRLTWRRHAATASGQAGCEPGRPGERLQALGCPAGWRPACCRRLVAHPARRLVDELVPWPGQSGRSREGDEPGRGGQTSGEPSQVVGWPAGEAGNETRGPRPAPPCGRSGELKVMEAAPGKTIEARRLPRVGRPLATFEGDEGDRKPLLPRQAPRGAHALERVREDEDRGHHHGEPGELGAVGILISGPANLPSRPRRGEARRTSGPDGCRVGGQDGQSD